MTKSELIEAIAARGELTKARAEMVVNCVFDAMTESLQRGEGIEIRGYGSFTVRPYKPYAGRNPRTGQPVPVPAKRLPFFKVGKELKELVNDSRHIPITGGDEGDDDDDDDDDEDNDE
jgi:integration host factor subunit beta